MESSTSWFCAGAKAMAGEPLQQHHCQRYPGVWIWSYFHFVQSSPRLRHRLKPMTPPTAPFPAYFSHCRSLIPVWFSGNDYVKITRSREWGSHCVKAENGLPCRLSEYFAAQVGWSLWSRQNPLLPLDWLAGMWHCFWPQGHESQPLTVCVLCLNLQQHPWPLRLPLFPEDAAGSAEGDTLWLAGEENARRHGPEVPESSSGKQGRLHQRWGTRAVVVASAVPTSSAYINISESTLISWSRHPRQ